MFVRLYSLIAAAVIAAGSVSCSSGVDAEAALQQSEMALARGDMQVASSVAAKLSDGENLSGLTAAQLARLSMVYMQLADEDEQADEASKAADCYRRAFKANADSAAAYYTALPSEKAQYAMMLSAIVGNQDHPFDAELHMHEDSLLYGSYFTDSIN